MRRVSRPGRITSSAGGRGGQWALRRAALIAAFAVLAAGPGCGRKDQPTAEGRPTPSGLPVPRYVSLKFATVNGRGGPGDDYKILWTYRVKGLPLQVIAETPEWRRVCDPSGGVAWVRSRTVDGRRSVMRTSSRALELRRRPSEQAPADAYLVPRGIAELQTCREGWCRIAADRANGWVRASEVWGAADAPQCR